MQIAPPPVLQAKENTNTLQTYQDQVQKGERRITRSLSRSISSSTLRPQRSRGFHISLNWIPLGISVLLFLVLYVASNGTQLHYFRNSTPKHTSSQSAAGGSAPRLSSPSTLTRFSDVPNDQFRMFVELQTVAHAELYKDGVRLANYNVADLEAAASAQQNNIMQTQRYATQAATALEVGVEESVSRGLSHIGTRPHARVSSSSQLNKPITRSRRSPVPGDKSYESHEVDVSFHSPFPDVDHYVMPQTPQTLSSSMMNASQFIQDAGSSALGRASPSADFWGDQLAILGGVGDFQDLNIWTFDPSQAPNITSWSDWPILKGVPLICCGGQILGIQVDPNNPATNYLFWFGGTGLDNSYPNGVFGYDFNAYMWNSWGLGNAPSGRSFFCMVSIPSLDGNPDHTDILISSGFDGLQQVGDTWSYNTAGDFWTQLNTTNSQIAVRSHLGCDYHQDRNIVIAFGGQANDQFFNDLIYLNLTSMQWVEAPTVGYQPPPAAGVLNGAVVGDRFYIGRYPPAISNTPNWVDMAELHLDTWTWVYYPVPTSITFKEDEYWVSKPDGSGFLLVCGQLVDGASNVPTNEIYEFVPTRAQPFVLLWGNQLSAAAVAGHSMDLLGDVAVVFGGFQSAPASVNEDTVAISKLYFVPFRPDPTVHMQWFELPSTGIVPSARGWHATTLIDNQLYLFGGCSTMAPGNELGDFYTVNLGDPTDLASPSARIWVQLTNPSATTAALPAARAGASLLYLNGLLWLVGGANTVRNGQTDVWTYNLDTEVWAHVGTDADVTGNPNNCNYGYTQCVHDTQYIYCVGGCDTADCYNQLNVFDTVSLNWFVFAPPAGQEFQSFGHHSMVKVGDLAMIVNGGMGRDMMSTERFALFSLSAHRTVIQETPIASFTNGTWIREMLYVNNRPPPSRDERSFILGNTIFVQGGWGAIPFFDEAQLNTVETCLTETTYVKNILYSSPLTPLCPLVNGLQNTNSSQCFPCSVGTFFNQSSSQCQLCSPGQYQNLEGQTSCKLCPRGFFGVWYAAQSSNLCSPCPEGSYGPIAGATSCQSCNSSYFCPISTIIPAPRKDGVNDLLNSGGVLSTSQPTIADDQSHFIAQIQSDIYTVMGYTLLTLGTMFMLSFVCPSTTCCWKKVNKCYSEGHWHFNPVAEGEQVVPSAENVRAILKAQAVDVQVEARYQRLGGLLSIFATVISIMFAMIIIVPFWQQKYLESRFMLMNPLLTNEQVAAVSANISIQFDLVGYSGDCVSEQLAGHASGATDPSLSSPIMPGNFTIATSSGATACNQLIVMSSDFYGEITTVACASTVVSSFPTCSVTWTCVDCSMATLVNTIAFNSRESLAYAHWIQWTFETTTGYPDPTQTSLIYGVLTPSLGMSFRGPVPSALYFSVSSSIYQFALQNYLQGGYIAEFSTSTTGTEVDSANFELVSELQLRVQLQKTGSAILTVKTQTALIEDILAAVLGSVTGFLGVVALFLFQIEKYMWHCRKCRAYRWIVNRADAAEKAQSKKVVPSDAISDKNAPGTPVNPKLFLSTPAHKFESDVTVTATHKPQLSVEGYASSGAFHSPEAVSTTVRLPTAVYISPNSVNQPIADGSVGISSYQDANGLSFPASSGAAYQGPNLTFPGPAYTLASPHHHPIAISSPSNNNATSLSVNHPPSLHIPTHQAIVSGGIHQLPLAVPVSPASASRAASPGLMLTRVLATQSQPGVDSNDISFPKLQGELLEMLTPRESAP